MAAIMGEPDWEILPLDDTFVRMLGRLPTPVEREVHRRAINCLTNTDPTRTILDDMWKQEV